MDPLSPSYPSLTPYQYASNSPIVNIDIDGLEGTRYDMAAFDPGLNAINASPELRRYYQIMMGAGFGGGVIVVGAGLFAVETAGAAYTFAVLNPATVINSAPVAGGVLWGLGTDQDMPGQWDDVGKFARRVGGFEGLGDLSKRSFDDIPGISVTARETTGSLMGQEWGFTCVSCATRMVLADLGVAIPEAELMHALKTTRAGANTLNIPKAIERLGIEGITAKSSMMSLDELVKHVKAGNTTIASVILPRGGHSVVIDGIEEGNVMLRDPLPGVKAVMGNGGSSYSVSLEDFGQFYSGKTATIKGKK